MFEKIALFFLSFLGSRFKVTLGLLGLAAVSVLVVAGFRDSSTTRPPIELFPDMDRQPKLRPQTVSQFAAFGDGRTSRGVPSGTVAQRNGFSENVYWEDNAFNTGKENGAFVEANPALVTFKLINQGHERFTIYCQPCHGAQGDSNGGITKKLGMATVANLMDPRIIKLPDGEIFNTITHGKTTMMGYAAQIPPSDRWAIVAYVRALQLSRLGFEADVPAPELAKLKK
jgi:mono/diheme cytochrome c family protein